MAAAFYRDLAPEDLPVPGNQVMQLIQYVLKEDARVETIVQLVSVNPSLTAQLLGLVNSAFFGFRQKMNTVSDAVVAIGMESLRNIVLCFAVKEVLSRKQIEGFDIDAFWEDSVRRGVSAQQIARLIDGPVEQAFTAGMLQDIGLLVLFSLEPEKVDRWPLLRSNLPKQRHEMEEELFQTSHDSVGELLIHKWNLPRSYALAVGGHHRLYENREAGTESRNKKPSVLGGIMHLADLCNAVYACHDKGGALSLLKNAGRRLFQLKSEVFDEMLEKLPALVQDTSRALEIQVSSQLDFETVMNHANRKLAKDNISYQELTWELQKSLKERDEYAEKLEAELDIAREIQKSLQPNIGEVPQVSAFNIPAYHLSGDFYDYFTRPDGTICFCLGDVSGKGTAAALLMAKAVSLFRCLCKVVPDISDIVELMNNELCETAVRGMFVTFVGGWLNPDTSEISIVNVGHLPPFLINQKGIVKVEASDPPLGVMPGALHPARTISLKNRRLYLYTDGFTEGRVVKGAPEEIGEELGLTGFLKWLIMSRKLHVNQQADWIKEKCRTDLSPQSDDLTLMILSGETE